MSELENNGITYSDQVEEGRVTHYFDLYINLPFPYDESEPVFYWKDFYKEELFVKLGPNFEDHSLNERQVDPESEEYNELLKKAAERYGTDTTNGKMLMMIHDLRKSNSFLLKKFKGV